MKLVCTFLISLLCIIVSYAQSNYGEEYIAAWKKFYPSKAVKQGFHASIYDFENLGKAKIQDWIKYNENVLRAITNPNEQYTAAQSIDARLLTLQIKEELHEWKSISTHEHSLKLYIDLIDSSIKDVLSATYLNHQERKQLTCKRLEDIQHLCKQSKSNLKSLSQGEFARGTKALESIIDWIQNDFVNKVESWSKSSVCPNLLEETLKTKDEILSMLSHVKENLKPSKDQFDIELLGITEYQRRLKLYTDTNLTPQQIADLAQREIETVRQLIGKVSKKYLSDTYPNNAMPNTYVETVSAAFKDMESDVPVSANDYQQFWEDLSDRAIAFIEQKNIASLPEIQTLRIISAPESAGPAARIGWVDSAAPFDPNPITTLYLPSIPDTLPEEEQKDFWASFNKPFNRMIVIHELFPGHYMQIKISRATAHPIRLLFPYAPYFEGWATFTEKVLLDEGWDKERPLTYLAHLRKRLENANRAYTSVQVHCNNWTQEQVLQHSIDQALLAPQFAKSLWGRIMRSPLQLTSYFWGGHQFKELMKNEKERLGEAFDLKIFMDTIMKTGPIPIDEFYGIFKEMD